MSQILLKRTAPSHELDAKFYSVEEMINNTRRVFDTPNQEVCNKDQLITKVEIETCFIFYLDGALNEIFVLLQLTS